MPINVNCVYFYSLIFTSFSLGKRGNKLFILKGKKSLIRAKSLTKEPTSCCLWFRGKKTIDFSKGRGLSLSCQETPLSASLAFDTSPQWATFALRPTVTDEGEVWSPLYSSKQP